MSSYYIMFYCESCTPVPPLPPIATDGRRVVNCLVPLRRFCCGCACLGVTAFSAKGSGGGGGAGGGGGGGMFGDDIHMVTVSL